MSLSWDGDAIMLSKTAPLSVSTSSGTQCKIITEPPQKYVCSICTSLVVNPHLTACCGQEFCEGCIERWEKTCTPPTCPYCREENFIHILDKQAKREVELLKVQCSQNGYGCKWNGALREVGEHLKNCGFVTVKCTSCSNQMLRKDLSEHHKERCQMRESTCLYCKKVDVYFRIISLSHLALCPGYPMDCPNYCGVKSVKRCDLHTHRSTCPNETIHCLLKTSGCTAMLLRKDLHNHIETSQTTHIMQLMVAFQESQNHSEEQAKELKALRMVQASSTAVMAGIASNMDELLRTSLTTQLPALRSMRALVNDAHLILDAKTTREIQLTLPNFSLFEKKENSVWDSLPFFVQGGYKMSLRVFSLTPRGTMDIHLFLLPGEFDADLPWPCDIDFKQLYFSMEEQSGKNGDTAVQISTKKKSYSVSPNAATSSGPTRTNSASTATTLAASTTTHSVSAMTHSVSATTHSVSAMTQGASATTQGVSATTQGGRTTTQGGRATTQSVSAMKQSVSATRQPLSHIFANISINVLSNGSSNSNTPANMMTARSPAKPVSVSTRKKNNIIPTSEATSNNKKVCIGTDGQLFQSAVATPLEDALQRRGRLVWRYPLDPLPPHPSVLRQVYVSAEIDTLVFKITLEGEEKAGRKKKAERELMGFSLGPLLKNLPKFESPISVVLPRLGEVGGGTSMWGEKKEEREEGRGEERKNGGGEKRAEAQEGGRGGTKEEGSGGVKRGEGGVEVQGEGGGAQGEGSGGARGGDKNGGTRGKEGRRGGRGEVKGGGTGFNVFTSTQSQTQDTQHKNVVRRIKHA